MLLKPTATRTIKQRRKFEILLAFSICLKCKSGLIFHIFKLLAEFPDLAKFSGYWPVNDLMLMRLKALKAKIRKQTRMEAAGALLRGKPKGKSRAN